MPIAAWKRLEKNPGYQRKKLFLKRLVGQELRLKPDMPVRAVRAGGWWFHPDTLDGDSVVYSLGIGEDLEFDLALIRSFDLAVHAFDPTPSTVDWLAARQLPSGFCFHPWAIAAEDGMLTLYPRIRRDGSRSTVMYTMLAGDAARDDGIQVPAFSLVNVAARLGHERIDLLKMDIEGAEYDVLDNLLDSAVKPVQLLVEFHHRFPGIGLQKTAGTIMRLRNSGYRIFAVSETGREVSFMHVQGNSEEYS